MIEILTKDEFLKYNNITENHKYEYGCVMGFFKNSFENPTILSDDIYDEPGYGYETEPHVTILFGLHHNELDLNQLYDILYNTELFEINTNKISSFENDYDVLKWEIEKTEELLKLNELLVTSFPNTQNFPNYEPHVTIAYLKKGCAEKYVTELPNTIKKKIDFWVYSMPDGTKMKIVPNFSIEDYKLNFNNNNEINIINAENILDISENKTLYEYDIVKKESVFSKDLNNKEVFIIPNKRLKDMYNVIIFENQIYNSMFKSPMSLEKAIKMILEM